MKLLPAKLESGAGRRGRPLQAIGTVSAAFLLSFGAMQEPGDADGARATIEGWMEVNRLISKEETDWKLDKSILEDRIRIVERDIQGLRASIAETETGIGDLDTKRLELQTENDRLMAASAAFEETVITLEERVRELLPRLPKPLRENVQIFSQLLPEDSMDTDTGISQRYMSVIAILNAANKFNAEVSVHSERRELPGGATAEVATMYLGLGQAFYVSRNGQYAGVGMPTDDGWKWTPSNESAEAFALAIGIFNGEEGAAFVQLPVEIQ